MPCGKFGSSSHPSGHGFESYHNLYHVTCILVCLRVIQIQAAGFLHNQSKINDISTKPLP